MSLLHRATVTKPLINRLPYSFSQCISHSYTRAYSTEGKRTPNRYRGLLVLGGLLGIGSFALYRQFSDGKGGLVDRMTSIFSSFGDPVFEKLLPDRIADPKHPRPYTLVVDLDKFLVCHVWDAQQGRWRIAKRPGADLFLFYAAQLYEVVVFSSLPQHEGDAIVKKLDPYGCISYSLYRFATRYRNGSYIKDLGLLNRDLSKVIVLGHDAASFQPIDNMIPMQPWDGRAGSAQDETLEAVVDFLEMLAFSRHSDIRPVICRYRDLKLDDSRTDLTSLSSQQKQMIRAAPFPQNFDLLQEAALNASQMKQSSTLVGRIASALGKSRSSHSHQLENEPDSSSEVSSTFQWTDLTRTSGEYWKRKRERMSLRRKEYARIRKLMQQQLEAEMRKEKEYYDQHKMTLWDLFTKGPPPPPPPTTTTSNS